MSKEGQTDGPVTEGDGESDTGGDVVDRETAVEKASEDEDGVPTDDSVDTDDDVSIDDRPVTEVAADEDLDLETRAEHIEQRELGLDKRAEDLEERKAKLDERERELDTDREKLAEKRSTLKEREATIEQQEAELDEREQQVREREAELDEIAQDLEQKDQTIRQYVADQVGEAVDERIYTALEEAQEETTAGRFGPTGGLLVGLVGLTLVTGGVALALTTQASNLASPIGGTTTSVIASALLIVVGLGANLAAAADRV